MSADHNLPEYLSDLPYVLGEIVLAGGIILLSILAIFRFRSWQLVRILSAIVIVISMYFTLVETPEASIGFFILGNDFSMLFWKVLLDITALIVLFFKHDRHLKSRAAEYQLLALTLLLGAHLLIISNHLFITFLGVEILSLSGYMLVALPVFRDNVVSGFKYLVFGGVSSAIMIYGISLYYGMADTLLFKSWDDPILEGTLNNGYFVTHQLMEEPIGIIAILMITLGIFFKIGAAPMHLWVADVYQGTSYPILTILSVIPKLAGFAFLSLWIHVVPFPIIIFGSLALLTIIVGNFGALMQQNVRRLMGFSAIAHTGFMMLALLYSTEYLAFYAVVYVVMTIGIFHLLNHFYFNYGLDSIEGYNGFRAVSRIKTIFIVIWMIALTGLPPTAGFTAKLLVFTGLGEVYAEGQDSFVLILILAGILNAVVSLAYYLKLPYAMIFKQISGSEIKAEKIVTSTNLFGTLLVLLVLLLFIRPDWLMNVVKIFNFAL